MNILEASAEHMERNGWRPDGFDMDDGSLCLVNTIHKVFSLSGEYTSYNKEQWALWAEILETCALCFAGVVPFGTASDYIAYHNDLHVINQFEAVDLLKRAAKRIDV